jgi:DNA repair exonuclease SbcCD ATPase subunit
VAELKVQILRLEDALAAETKRRVDATTSLDDKARDQIYEMEERLQEQMMKDNKRLEARLEQVEARMEELGDRWEKDSAVQLNTISRKSQDFEKELKQLQLEQDTERKARLRREGNLLQQVENHATEFEERWKLERDERENRIDHLEQNMNQQLAKGMHDEQIFQQKVQTELEELQRELEEESLERQTQDQEIVEALNRYTKQLQESLSILSCD